MSDLMFEMDIHDEGIILVKMIGTFDFDVWLAKRKHILETRLSGINLYGRPSIVDLRMSDPPPGNWTETFLSLYHELTRVGEGTGPIAVVLGRNPAKFIVARLYIEIVRLNVGAAPPVISFATYNEAYQWVMKNDKWRDEIRRDDRAN